MSGNYMDCGCYFSTDGKRHWCPTCTNPLPSQKAFTHEPEPKPPASEGVRESTNLALKYLREIHKTLNDDGRFPMAVPEIEKAIKEVESLAALPELERVECYMPAHKWPDNDPKKCYQCKGTGEVWVRKAGV